MKNYNVRTSSENDILSFFGVLPPYATKSWSIDYDGELAAIAGVQYTPTNVLVFSDIKKNLDVPNITIWRGTLEVFDKIKALNKPLVAVCTGEFLNSGAYLKRLGFNFFGYEDDMEVYQWPKP